MTGNHVIGGSKEGNLAKVSWEKGKISHCYERTWLRWPREGMRGGERVG